MGASCLLYLLPALCGMPEAWLLQMALSFGSDFACTGQASWVHPADRLSALALSVYMIWTSLRELGLAPTLFLTSFAFAPYVASRAALRWHDYDAYVRAHSLWHLTSALANVIVLLLVEAAVR